MLRLLPPKYKFLLGGGVSNIEGKEAPNLGRFLRKIGRPILMGNKCAKKVGIEMVDSSNSTGHIPVQNCSKNTRVSTPGLCVTIMCKSVGLHISASMYA